MQLVFFLTTEQHLKGRFGDAFTLEFHAPPARIPELKTYILQTFPTAAIDEGFAGYLRYRVMATDTTLVQVFRGLEGSAAAGATDHGFSQTSLEQVSG